MISLSVIVPTRNRALLLDGLLHSLTSQTYPADRYEVIVVDNGSKDNTLEICQSYTDRIHNLRYLYESQPGLHIGRHLGLKEAKGNILVYADDDIETFPTWLSAIAEAFEDSDVVLVGGNNVPKFIAEPPIWFKHLWVQDADGNRSLGYLSILDLGNRAKVISPYYVYGCNFSIRKSILIDAGGFHPDAMPENLICYRGDGESHISQYILLNELKAFFHPLASVYHLIPAARMTKEYFCRRAYLQGISDSYTQMRRQVIEKRVDYMHGGQSPYLCQLKGIIIRSLHSCMKGVINLLPSRKHERLLNKIQNDIAFAYFSGWKYHRTLMKNDPQLLEYVLQHNYLFVSELTNEA